MKILRNPGILGLIVIFLVGFTIWLILSFGLPIQLAWAIFGLVVFILGIFTYLGNKAGKSGG